MFLELAKENFKSISVKEIENLLDKIQLIDIREPYEYMDGHLPKAKNIPMANILSETEKYLNRSDEYYIICRSGVRSSMACNELAAKGYKVIDILGGTGSYRGSLRRNIIN